MATERIQIVTPVVKAQWPNLSETEKFSGQDTEKYSLTMIIDPKDKKLFEKAIAEAGGGKGKSPLKEIPDDAEYDAGMLKIKARTKHKVRVVDLSGSPIERDSVTNGSEVRAKINFVPYTQQGGGVTAYLGDVQLLKARTSDIDFGDLPEGYGEYEEGDLPF